MAIVKLNQLRLTCDGCAIRIIDITFNPDDYEVIANCLIYCPACRRGFTPDQITVEHGAPKEATQVTIRELEEKPKETYIQPVQKGDTLDMAQVSVDVTEVDVDPKTLMQTIADKGAKSKI